MDLIELWKFSKIIFIIHYILNYEAQIAEKIKWKTQNLGKNKTDFMGP